MATASYTFKSLPEALGSTFLWETGSAFKVALLDNSIDLSPRTHSLFSEISTAEIGSANYTAGGEPLLSAIISTALDYTTFDADDVSWLAMTSDIKYAVIYKVATSELVGYFDLDTGVPAGISLVGQPLDLIWSSGYIFRVYNP